MTTSGSFWRDANRVPITTDGIVNTAVQTLSGSNTTVATPLFRITGTIESRGLWGIITTPLGDNVTATHWRLNDQSAQVVITASAGTVLSSSPAGSFIRKPTTSGTALVHVTGAGGRVGESSANHMSLQCFMLTQKAGANTDVEFVYTTTNTPTSGVIQHFLRWIPLSIDGNVTSLL